MLDHDLAELGSRFVAQLLDLLFAFAILFASLMIASLSDGIAPAFTTLGVVAAIYIFFVQMAFQADKAMENGL